MCDDDSDLVALLPSPLALALVILAALLASCLLACSPVHGAPAPPPKPKVADIRRVEAVRKVLTGRWAMGWSGDQPSYEVEFRPDGVYVAWNATYTYTGKWSVVSRDGRTVLVIEERVAYHVDLGPASGDDPLRQYEIALDPKDCRQGRFLWGGRTEDWSRFRLYEGWDQVK